MHKQTSHGIFLTVKDLMRLTGSESYSSCAKLHKSIREAITRNKRKLTVREYCEFEKIDFLEITAYLEKG